MHTPRDMHGTYIEAARVFRLEAWGMSFKHPDPGPKNPQALNPKP